MSQAIGCDRERVALPPARGRRLGVALALTALLVAAAAQTAQAQPLSRTVVPPVQRLATLLSPHDAHTGPDPAAPLVERVPGLRPITNAQTVLPVLGETTGADGRDWLHVRLPGRPNGHTGWIVSNSTLTSTTPWRIVVDTARRRVVVYRNGRAVRSMSAVIGKPSTPTPRGQFFVEEVVQLRASDSGAPFAVALSARSNVLQEFDGGPGQIALHGLLNIGGVPGTAVSHGCVRLSTATMRWLVLHVAPGTPVTIT